jgi:cis-3-alkyl-4-acyloxetan-2-one decarboxylase
MNQTQEQTQGWRSEYPFQSHYYRSEKGVRLHYLDERPHGTELADRPTILCVHGNPTWSFYYRSIVSHFRSTHRVIAVDHVGCGLSDKPRDYPYALATHTSNLVRFIEELDLRKIVLVVHDWGGAIGLGAAVEHLPRMAGMIVLNTGAFPPPFIPKRIALCRFPVLGSWAMRYLNAFAKAAIFMAIDRLPRLSENARDGLLAPYNTPANRIAIERFVQDIPMNASHPTWRVLEELERNLPQLGHLQIRLVWGMRDWCFTPECLERLHRAWPNAVRRELSDVGHYVMEEATQEVAEELRSVLQLCT